MSKYKIEGCIDFFSELYKSLDVEDNLDENNLCLITSQPLTNNCFMMDCGHKFNYIPLYLDIKNHKLKFNSMEDSSSRLNHNEIRCPYCRKKQTNLLPYYEELDLCKIHGINYINPNYTPPISVSSNYKKCEFLTVNPNFDASGNNIVEIGDYNNNSNCKFYKCSHLGSQINYYNGITEGNNFADEKYYCWNHKKEVVKKYKKDIKDKANEEIKKSKLKAKEDAKNALILEKQKAKEEKQKEKDELKANKQIKKIKIVAENVVLYPTIIEEESIGCIEILRTGANKGTKCGCKVIQDNICKRHYNLKHHIIINEK
jgi:hypothetical protein